MSWRAHDSPAPTVAPKGPSRRVALAEVAVFLSLILPPLVLSLFTAGEGGPGFVPAATSTIANDLALVALILFFLWRNGEGPDRLGWRPAHPLREAVLGILLFVPVAAAVAGLDVVLHAVGLPPPPPTLPAALQPRGSAELTLAAALVAVVAVAEETIFRGYLILRLAHVTRSTGIAIIVSSVIFALGHGYEGTIGAISVGFMGLLLALIYIWRGALLAPIVIHFLQDALSILLRPLLHAGP